MGRAVRQLFLFVQGNFWAMETRYLRLKWKRIETGARLLRMEGTSGDVVVPEKIEGYPVTEIGDYCFSTKEPKLEGEIQETEIGKKEETHEISGAYLTKMSLPDTVERIGNFAFYNCNKLEEIAFGKKLEKVGSDAFMNCMKLKSLTVRSSVREKTGLKQILTQLSGKIVVTFLPNGICEAHVLYPEYFETYDEISPAHIFGRNIEGEGFRARQCFEDGVIQFAQYDTIFQKACAEETAEIRIQLAVNRLRYPIDLKKESRDLYEKYLTTNADEEAVYFLKKRDQEVLHFLCENHYISEQGVTELIKKAAELEWAEGAASLMQWKARFWKKEVKDRYSFDEF